MARKYGKTHAGRGTQREFSVAPRADIQRSVLNRNSNLKSTFDEGMLVPIFLDEALPGDTIHMRMSTFTRMATPRYPVMDNMYMDFFFFAVPYRLVWDNWQKFNGEQDNPDDSTDFLVPLVNTPSGGYNEKTLGDYFGLPTKVVYNTDVSALPFRAYNLIYNEWFRDQNLIDSKTVNKDDGPDPDTDYELLRRGKRHDYFTSCLPWPQKGPTIYQRADVIGDSTTDEIPLFDYSSTTGGQLVAQSSGDNVKVGLTVTGGDGDISWNDPKLVADISVNQLRQSFQVQKMFERDARGGTRYTEILNSHFGVTSPDQRLQRPEYLGGGTVTINVNPISATAQISVPVGDLGAFVTATSTGTGFNKSFVEHCLIMGIVSVRADLNYQQGIDRMWSRRTRFDFYWPALAHLGEQAVLNKEIFVDGTAADEDVFGYQERYGEYRYKPSKVTGEFRSNADTPLDIWHLAQDFGSRPLLNETFIEEAPPISRVLFLQSDAHFLFDAYFEYRCARPMPTYSVPGLVDHF